MKDKLKIGIVGLGRTRGYPIFEVFCGEENAEVVGLCDLYDERINAAEKRLEELGKKRVFSTKNYSELLAKAGPDAVFIATSWNHHVDIAVEAMERGIAVAMEVGGAYSEEDCWRLVRTYERTKTPFMYMENCCFNRSEMMLANMARDGLFGKIVHCSGSYAHDLRDEVFKGEEKKHYTKALFVAIGQVPDNKRFENLADLDKDGYFASDERCLTKTEGLFVAGDCRAKKIRQLTTACCDGACAAMAASEFIDKMGQ